MRAFFIRRYGGPEVLEEGELPAAPLGPRDVRITVHAASVNPVDWKIREGKTKVVLPYRFPLVLGNDCSGVVREVGAEVTARRHRATYRYWFMHSSGEQLRHLATLVEQGVLRPHVDRVFPFAQTKEAVAYAESGKARGKVVVSLRE